MTMTDNHDDAVYETLPDLGPSPDFPVYEDMIYPGWEITVVEETDLDEEQPLIDPKMFPYRYNFHETTFVFKDTLPLPRVSALIPSALSSSPENLSRSHHVWFEWIQNKYQKDNPGSILMVSEG